MVIFKTEDPVVLLDAVSTNNTVSSTVDVSAMDNVVLLIFASGGSTGDILVRSSEDRNADLSSAASVSNLWGYANLYNLDSGSNIVGSTGVQYAASSGVTRVILNFPETTRLISVELANYTGGNFTVKLVGSIKQDPA